MSQAPLSTAATPFSAAATPTADVKFITWAKETEFARSFWNGVVQGTPLVEEAWVVIWPEHLGTTAFEQGVDQAQLAADYQALTGNQLALPQ